MTATAQDYLNDLQKISIDQSSESRREALRRITDLFIVTSDMQSETDNAEFGDAISKIASNTDESARAELSHRIAKRPDTPRNLAFHLANDTITVAEPVLEHAINLTSEDLAAIARNHGQAHMLAICKRLNIDPQVTDVLVERGEEAVLKTVAKNNGAAFSRPGYETITKRAEYSLAINEALLKRPDFPNDLRPHVNTNVTNGYNQEFANTNVDSSLEEMSHDPSLNSGDETDKIRVPFKKEITLLYNSGNLQQDTVVRFSRAKCLGSTAFAIAMLVSLDIKTVYHCIFEGSPMTLAILCRALDFNNATFWEIIELRKSAGKLPGNFLLEAGNILDTIDKNTSQRVLRFLKVRMLAKNAA